MIKRGLNPQYVCSDSSYASLSNLKTIYHYDWQWLTWLKTNRLVNSHEGGKQILKQFEIGLSAAIVRLKGYD